MIKYYLILMGPINKEWIEKNGKQWCAGRIDIDDGSPYGVEYAVSPMHYEDWNEFREWLMHHQTEKLLSKQELFSRFESERNKLICWFKKETENA